MKNMFLKYAMERNIREKIKINKWDFLFPEEQKDQENTDFFFFR